MRDQERGLTARGRRDALAIGAYLARHALVPDLVLASPALKQMRLCVWEAPVSRQNSSLLRPNSG